MLGLLQTEHCVAQSPAPFSGKKSEWKGFPRYDFELAGRMVTVVTPAKSSSGVPWLWRGEFFGAFATVDEALLKLGWHVVYMACPNTFGSPDTMQRWSQLYDELTRHHPAAECDHPRPRFEARIDHEARGQPRVDRTHVANGVPDPLRRYFDLNFPVYGSHVSAPPVSMTY